MADKTGHTSNTGICTPNETGCARCEAVSHLVLLQKIREIEIGIRHPVSQCSHVLFGLRTLSGLSQPKHREALCDSVTDSSDRQLSHSTSTKITIPRFRVFSFDLFLYNNAFNET